MTGTPARRAVDFCADIALDDEARALLGAELGPRAYLDLLVERELHTDAVKVLARLLPKRRAVAWACACLREAAGHAEGPEDRACVEAAERWVAEPSEDHRRAALAAAESAGYGGPSAWAAAAAGWSGGSLAAPGMPAVPPADHLTAQAVAGVIVVLAAGDPEQFDERQQGYLQRGLEQLASDGGTA